VAHALVRAASRLLGTPGAFLRIPVAQPHCIGMNESRRRLSHRYPRDTWLFLTWHLAGSIPQTRRQPSGNLPSGKGFVWMDRYLDTTRDGPMHLRQEPIARVVQASLHRGVDLGHYELGAYAIMANHVHALLLPKVAPSRLLQSLKGATAREANRLLGRTGEPFWQRESYGHWVRDEAERGRIARYIESNPVAAGLVRRAEDYPWSSAGERGPGVATSGDAARTSAHATSDCG